MRTLLLVVTLIGLTVFASGDNWPRWRGPAGTGQSTEKNLPLKWAAEGNANIRWKTDLPGPGMSSPIVWGDRIFLTQALDKDGKQRAILCFNRKDGKELWRGVTEYGEKESTYPG